MNRLKEIRIKANLTQEDAAKLLKISRGTYIKYEQIYDLSDSKLDYYIFKLKEYTLVDETHGILSIDEIKKIVCEIMSKYSINSCYLFGSYAKGKANPSSDVDLMIDSEITGLDFYGLVEELRNGLRKKVDLLTLKSLSNNATMLSEILKDGIKIYG